MKRHALWLLALSAGTAHAQATRMMMPEGTYDMYLGVARETTFRADSDGTSRSVIVPALEVQWSNGVFASIGTRGAEFGAHLSDSPMFDYGTVLSMSGRDQRADTPGERGGVAFEAGAFANWSIAHNLSVGASLLAGGGFDRGGLLGNVRASFATPLAAHHTATLEAGCFVADHSWMQGYFGVSPAQAANGANPQYRAQAGVLKVYADLGWNWQLANKYWLSNGLRVSRLGSSAAASPLAGARDRASIRTALTYHF